MGELDSEKWMRNDDILKTHRVKKKGEENRRGTNFARL